MPVTGLLLPLQYMITHLFKNYPGDVTGKGTKTSAEVKNAWSRTRSPHTPADFGVLTEHGDDF